MYRGVAVEETVLSHLSRPGVHATARLLELHPGQSPLKPPGGDSSTIKRTSNLKTSPEWMDVDMTHVTAALMM